MSAMELHIDHLAALVNIGHQLDIRNVYSEHSNLTQRLSLDEERDRNYVLTELVCQMTTSVAYRYSEKAPLISEVPEVRIVRGGVVCTCVGGFGCCWFGGGCC